METCRQSEEIICRGEIYWFRYGGGKEGSEQQGTRPCVVVSNEKANQFSPIITVVPLTSAAKKRLPTHIDVRSAIVPSVALCEQVSTIAKDRLSTYIGVCTDEEMAAIDRGLLIQLGLKLQKSVRRTGK